MRWLKAATLRKIRYRRKVLGGGGSKLRSGFPFVQLNTDLEKKLLEVAGLELADTVVVTSAIWAFGWRRGVGCIWLFAAQAAIRGIR
jgi:hypothetical protein